MNYILQKLRSHIIRFTNYKKINLKINFFLDNSIDTDMFTITVPKNVSKDDVVEALQKGHQHLCEENETDTYGTCVELPTTLLDYVCKKNNWQWNNFEF